MKIIKISRTHTHRAEYNVIETYVQHICHIFLFVVLSFLSSFCRFSVQLALNKRRCMCHSRCVVELNHRHGFAINTIIDIRIICVFSAMLSYRW